MPTLRRVPGCDAFYQPYSALEAESAVSMIVEAAIDALVLGSQRSQFLTWVAATRTIAESGGVVLEKWKARNGDPRDGRFKIDREWNIVATCPLCNRL